MDAHRYNQHQNIQLCIHLKQNLMTANGRLKVTKNTFYHKIYISFRSAVIHSTSFTIKIDFNYFANGLHSEREMMIRGVR